jgi:hypothetical protein
VCTGVAGRQRLIPALAQAFTVAHHHRANRHLARFGCPLREAKRMLHPRAVNFILSVVSHQTPLLTPHSHSIVNKPRKDSNGAGFPVVTSVNTMKNTIINNSLGNSVLTRLHQWRHLTVGIHGVPQVPVPL